MKHTIIATCLLTTMLVMNSASLGVSRSLAQIITPPVTSIESLSPGETKTASIPAAPLSGGCIVGETQFAIQYPGDGSKLVIDFHPSIPMRFAIRQNLPVAVQGNHIIADIPPDSFTPRVSLPEVPPFDAATYFIAVLNCFSQEVSFTLTATLVPPPTEDTIDIGFPSESPAPRTRLEVGSIPAQFSYPCLLANTQYTISINDSPYCGAVNGWAVYFGQDRNLTFYVRLGQRVTFENGQVMADSAFRSPNHNLLFSVFSSNTTSPRIRKYYIAVESCVPDAATYSLLFSPIVGDVPPPGIIQVFLERNKLHVIGYNFGPVAKVLLDGEEVKTKSGGLTPQGQEILIVKNAKSKIAEGRIVIINVKTSSGCLTPPFAFARGLPS